MTLFQRLWRLEGTIDRVTYLVGGVVAFAVKYAIDWTIAELVFRREWSPLSYWHLVPLRADVNAQVTPAMFLSLLVVSIPFLWFGMAMTLLRLRDAGRSAGWAALFFVPGVNAFLFALLSLLPSRPLRARDLSGVLESALFAVVGTAALATAAIGLGTQILKTYGIGLFVAIPFCVGYLAALLTARRHPDAGARPYLTAFLSIVLLGGFLLAMAWEGVICLVMAMPLALTAAMIGAYFGNRSGTGRPAAPARTAMSMAVLPLLLILEAAVPQQAPVYRVETSIVIDAPVEEVWRNVVSFSAIPDEPEWYFRAGIAYPLHARIVGRGVGAVRYCQFTTGAFVEPIEVWDEPRLLRFGVTSNPAPMHELSPYGAIDAPHLDGFLVSKRGQFALESLGGGRTRVTGTTWYQHHLWPAPYWTLWSDAILHRIHLRVLRHVKQLSES